jgi:ATP-dependent DNA helicase RecG
VGRGQHQSYCLLLADTTTPDAEARLHAISETNDGFKLAEEDLKLRGPGEFFGTRQSGLPDIKLAKLGDIRLLELARNEAKVFFEEDPDLSRPEHRLLARKLNEFWQVGTDLS